ncbi:MAG TPA: adenine phosphoribosyltransferase [Bacillota bacterium]|nr:adenine phosphoribosyltransferase [Bacillota bacterium]HPZ21487.1 adenine phosphoribosyltransferase [Bacillota bacterium]HQD19347.1 adenine phosphoribosyltransferase [Bacillota bacterium]
MNLKDTIRIIPDFPKPGIQFIDITTMLKDGKAMKYAFDKMAAMVQDYKIDLVVGPEARGFLIGAPLAYKMGAGFVPVRKSGKLPGEVIEASYQLEYGEDTLQIHKDAITPGIKVLVVDDLLATGGTVWSTADLVRSLGGEIVGFLFLVELTFLKGREKLGGYPVFSLLQYDSE